MGSLRDLPGIRLAMRLTSGLIASAKKRAQPIMRRPALALARRYSTATKPMITSQKRIKVLVSIWILVVVLMGLL